jgi:hypothetical protein
MDAQDYLGFAATKEVKYLYRAFLEVLEDIHFQHDASLSKLMDGLPEEQKSKVIQASFLDDESYQRFRKVILDRGNQSARAILEELEKYEIGFRRE